MKALLHLLSVSSVLCVLSWESRSVAAPAQALYVIVAKDVTGSVHWTKDRTYVIAGEVHVRAGAHLHIDDGVTILVRNGLIPDAPLLQRAALLFDSGSELTAERMRLHAADAKNQEIARADNGGLWFLGSSRRAEKDGVSAPSSRSAALSHFRATRIEASYLGARDPLTQGTDDEESAGRDEDDSRVSVSANDPDDGPGEDDLDGVSVLGCKAKEWQIQAVISDHSGDDGFDLTNSTIAFDELVIKGATEDGLNISSSELTIRVSLQVMMGRSAPGKDREIFDLEVDDGPSFVIMNPSCHVNIKGYLGDELKLASQDMPQPEAEFKAIYAFDGQLGAKPSLVLSINQD